MGLETELKFLVNAPRAFRARLRRSGFRPRGRRTLESNWIFDDPRAGLRRHGRLLRLRHSGQRWLLTAKGPRLPGALKRRPEVETPVGDGAACRRLLELLGYQVQMTYRRHRTVWQRASERGEIAWDETPMGIYLEIEGSTAWVRRTARELGLEIAAAEPRSYPELYATRRPKGRSSPARPRPKAAGTRRAGRGDARRG